uniref:Secreted protein n=1 Tax=Cannabis sativa TaxID=3483 RepID=A0A803QGZ1_CANSA
MNVRQWVFFLGVLMLGRILNLQSDWQSFDLVRERSLSLYMVSRSDVIRAMERTLWMSSIGSSCIQRSLHIRWRAHWLVHSSFSTSEVSHSLGKLFNPGLASLGSSSSTRGSPGGIRSLVLVPKVVGKLGEQGVELVPRPRPGI